MMKRRICFFSGDITRSGGTERAAISVISQVAKRGLYDVVILSLVEQNDAPFYDISADIHRYKLSDSKKWIPAGPKYLPLLARLRHFLKENEIDVIVDIDAVLDVLSLNARRGLKTKIISWDHFSFEYEMQGGYRTAIVKYESKRVDYIVTLTPRDADSFAKVLGRTSNITSIYNPVEPNDKVRPYENRQKLILTAGHLIERKGIDFIEKLAPKVMPAHPDWKWVILGDGPMMDELKSSIMENGLEPQVILAGRVKDIESRFADSRLYVMTSRDEGLPMVLIEAKTAGLPCIAFDVCDGVHSLISHGENGYLVEPFDIDVMANHIESLLDDENLCRSFSDKSKMELAEFDRDYVTDRWIDLLGKMTDEKRVY